MPMPSAAFSATSCSVLSSWLAMRDVAAGDALEQSAAIGNAHPFALRLQFADALLDIGVVQPAATAQRTVEVEIGVLPYARAVIHQADNPHQHMISDSVEQRQHVQRGNLAAQVQEVLGLQQILHR